MESFTPTAIYEHHHDGNLTITSPELPGIISYAPNMEEAREEARKAVESMVMVLNSYSDISVLQKNLTPRSSDLIPVPQGKGKGTRFRETVIIGKQFAKTLQAQINRLMHIPPGELAAS